MWKNVTPPDPCSGPIDPRALTGIRYFNAGEYFEAHEWLETAWREERGQIRNLYRGILQVGVGYHHITRGNYNGAIKLFERCRQWLELFPGDCLGIDVAGLLVDFSAVEAEVKRLGEDNIAQFNRALLKPVRFLSEKPSSEEHT